VLNPSEARLIHASRNSLPASLCGPLHPRGLTPAGPRVSKRPAEPGLSVSVDVLAKLPGQDPRPGVRILTVFQLVRDLVAGGATDWRAVAVGHRYLVAIDDASRSPSSPRFSSKLQSKAAYPAASASSDFAMLPRTGAISLPSWDCIRNWHRAKPHRASSVYLSKTRGSRAGLLTRNADCDILELDLSQRSSPNEGLANGNFGPRDWRPKNTGTDVPPEALFLDYLSCLRVNPRFTSAAKSKAY